MDQRIETRVIDTGGGAKNTIIQKNASRVWWISVSPETKDTKGLIQLYDGFDAEGKLKWQQEPAYSEHDNFIPPIRCDQGIFIYNDAAIGCYTIAYEPTKWEEEAK